METEAENMNSANLHATTTPHSHHLNLSATITELKHDIATISKETQALFQQCLPQSNTTTPYSSVTCICKPVWVFFVNLGLER